MKTLTLTLDDRLYSALEEQAETTGRAIDELAAEAIELWLVVGDLDEEELAEIEAAVRDWEENGGMEAEEFFRSVREEWLKERPLGVDVAGMVAHPAYQRIIGMGEEAVPFILQELERRPDHWFWALYAITGSDPVSEDAQGNLSKMTDAWLDWGHKNGYRWQSVVD